MRRLLLAAVAASCLAARAEAVEIQKGRLSLVGQKMLGPQTRMSEAGIRLSLNRRVKLELSYERTGYAPIMPFDHDDGIMTALRFAF